jgi:sugar/nucleoside kinase (ribokinase family)
MSLTYPSTSSRTPSVICAGVLVADHLTTPIDHVPASGELVAADELLLNIGGCASNAAMALARLGIPTLICGKVGDDVFGKFVATTLEQAGVDVRGLGVDRQRATSQSLIINVKGQDRRFIHSFGANRGLTVSDLDPLLALKPKVVYLGGYLILPADYLKHLRPVLSEVDAFLPNTDEASLILNETDPVRQALAFHEMGARHVVITCGDRGSVAVSNALKARLGTYPVTFVDGTGGGDAFDAGDVAGILEGLDEIGCLKLASALGASCVRAVGTTAGLFSRDEAFAFIEEHPLPIEHLG